MKVVHTAILILSLVQLSWSQTVCGSWKVSTNGGVDTADCLAQPQTKSCLTISYVLPTALKYQGGSQTCKQPLNEVILEAGTYSGPKNFALNLTTSIADLTLHLKSNNERTQTIIDAQKQGRIIDMTHSPPNLILESLTLKNVVGEDKYSAGAIHMILDKRSILVKITDCSFDNNHAFMDGGAINLIDSRLGTGSLLQISDSSFTNNKATQGGAIYVLGNKTSSAPTVINIQTSTFDQNSAAMGGALTVIDSMVTIGNNTFSNNKAGSKGGAISFDTLKAKSTVKGTKFHNNSAGSQGGALYEAHSGLTYQDCTFDTNDALHLGGGLCLYQSTSTIQDTLITGNNAEQGGGLALEETSVSGGPVVFAGVVQILKNHAVKSGGGVLCDAGTTEFPTFVTIAQNTAPQDENHLCDNGCSDGKGIDPCTGQPVVTNPSTTTTAPPPSARSSSTGGGGGSTVGTVFLIIAIVLLVISGAIGGFFFYKYRKRQTYSQLL